MSEEKVRQFEYCDKVDIHAIDLDSPLDLVTAIATEHGFRGVVVTLNRIEELVKNISKDTLADKKIVPIAVIDYPYGSLSTDVRRYSILSAKEKGAKEVEVVAPYSLFISRKFKEIGDDIQNLASAAKESNIKLRYVIDINSAFIDESVRTKIMRIVSNNQIEDVSTSLGFYDKKVDHSDSVLKMRNMKSKTGSQTKSFISDASVADLTLYAKAGVDTVGLDWKLAANVVHSYEDIINKK